MKGIVYKRGKSYSFKFDSINNENGRKQISKSGFDTKSVAEMELARAILEDYEGIYSISFREVCEEWLIGKNHIRENTKRSYKDTIYLHLLPHFKNKKTKDLRVKDINKYYLDKLKEGLSSTTVLYHHRILHMIIKYALINDYIEKNIMIGVESPLKSYHEIVLLNEEQIAKILIAARNNRALYSAIFIAINTGMRRGEICALRFSKHIDFKNRIIYVKNSTTGRKNSDLRTKTKASIRNIPISGSMYNHLIELKKDIKNDIDDYVVSQNTGEKTRGDYITMSFSKLMKKLKYVEKFSFKDFRHLHASIYLKIGVSGKVLQENLGHSRISTSLDVYSHLFPNMQEDAVIKFEEQYMKEILKITRQNKHSNIV